MRVLLTGGSGRLGSTLKTCLGPGVVAPSSADLDITDPRSIRLALESHQPESVVNCAAFTDVAAAEEDAGAAFELNVTAVFNLYRACLGAAVPLVQISTDHVFDGTKGMYRESDDPHPVGVYAVTKYLGERTVLLSENNAVLRTSFMNEFSLPAAFVDKYFSGDVVDVIARELALAIHGGVRGLWHVAGPRVSIYDIARKLNPTVGPMKLSENPSNRVGLPYLPDVSLDTSKWTAFKAGLAGVDS
jgi:dTDP-4-dehydrorhamnose reductase